MPLYREGNFRRGARPRSQGFVTMLPYRALVGPGIIQTKYPGFMCGLRLAPPDMESESVETKAHLCEYLAQLFSRLGDGWGTWLNVISRPAIGWPAGDEFKHPTMALIDEAQRRRFLDESANYEREAVLLPVYQLPTPGKQRWKDWLLGGTQETPGLVQAYDEFRRQINEIIEALSAWMGAEILSDDELVAHLDECIDGIHQRRVAPPRGRLFDNVFGHEFIHGYRPTIDGRHIRVIAISDYPPESHPLMLAGLGNLPASYRVYVRLVHLDPATADRALASYGRSWANKLHGPLEAIHRVLGGTARENPFALEMMNDVAAARVENEHGDFRPVYYSAGVVVTDDDDARLESTVRMIFRYLRHLGFGVREETLNASDGFLGSLAANGFFNPRRPPINTLNFAHMACLDVPWSGPEYNPSPYYPANSPVMLVGLTRGGAAFRYCEQVDDRGLVIILGPTGSGKTTLLAYTTAMQHRIPGSQTFNFDCGFGMYVLTLAAGGLHYDLGSDETCFQPLRNIDRPEERAWAHPWISEYLLALRGIGRLPERDQAIWRALELLGEAPVEERTISNFSYTVQDQTVRDGLAFYSHEGPLGRYLDADRDGLGDSPFITFEIEHLMAQGESVLIPVLTYLFHRIDQRLDGRPTRIAADELWIMLANTRFAGKLEEWLRTCRKKNAALVLATQGLADVANSPIRDVILESCPTKIYLPNPEARNPQTAELYQKFGLSPSQIDLIATATPKRHYYYVSPLGRRLFSLALTPAALAFVGAASRQDIAAARQLHGEYGDRWPAEWLRRRGLSEWAAYWEQLVSKMGVARAAAVVMPTHGAAEEVDICAD